MNTSDYLTQLQQDREDLVDNLETKGITGLSGDETFTELVPEVLNIQSGADLSEYFEIEPNSISTTTTSDNGWAEINFRKAYPELIVPNTQTSLTNLFTNWKDNKIPKVKFGSNITSLENVFGGRGSSSYASKATTIDVGDWNTSNVVNMSYCFANNSSLTSITNINTLNVGKVTNFQYCFYNCNKIQSLNINNWDISSAENINSMFQGMTTLKNIDLSNWGNCPCTNMITAFAGNYQLRTVDLKNFNSTSITSGGTVKDTAGMFTNCTQMTKIDLRSFDFTDITNGQSNMFGPSSSNGVPDNCLIIVADQTQKTWINTNISRLTNVKTVAEYEA